MVGFAVAFYRQFALTHPVMKLMTPHFTDTFAINELGRNTLLGSTNSDFERISAVGIKGSLQLMERYYRQRWSFAGFRVPNELAARGFSTAAGEEDGLPDYLYRDYSMLVWNAVHQYVERVVQQVLCARKPALALAIRF